MKCRESKCFGFKLLVEEFLRAGGRFRSNPVILAWALTPGRGVREVAQQFKLIVDFLQLYNGAASRLCPFRGVEVWVRGRACGKVHAN